MSKVQFRTSGTGLWSDTKTTVNITNMEVSATDYQFDNGDTKYPDFGELRVYFDDTWDLDRDGLIYTDDRFLSDLRAFLRAHGLPGQDVSYSEQGMQGDDYVSLDVGGQFLLAWGTKFGVKWERKYSSWPVEN